MSNSIVFGSQVEIFVDNGSGEGRLCEVSSFSSKFDDVVKKNSSLGETGVGTIDVLHDGGTCSIEAKLTDGALLGYIQGQDEHHRGGNQLGKRGKTPYLTIRQKIVFTDESSITVDYEGCVLHNLDMSASGKNEEVTIKCEGTYKRTSLKINGELASSSTGLGVAAFLVALVNFDGQKAPQNVGYSEIKPTSLYKNLSVGS